MLLDPKHHSFVRIWYRSVWAPGLDRAEGVTSVPSNSWLVRDAYVAALRASFGAPQPER
jgi:hypothetical protein